MEFMDIRSLSWQLSTPNDNATRGQGAGVVSDCMGGTVGGATSRPSWPGLALDYVTDGNPPNLNG